MRFVLVAVVGLVVAAGGCGGRPSPLEENDGGVSGDGGRPDGRQLDGGYHDGPIRGDAGARCDDIANKYFALADAFNTCGAGTDCTSFAIDCSIGAYGGAGSCYFYVGRSADTSRFAALVQDWKASGCPTAACHPCPAPPSLSCQAGRCAAGATCDPATCVSGPDSCCGRDCDPGTYPICNTVCPPVPPADPLCDCPQTGGCGPVTCDAAGSCPPGSRCNQGICTAIPRCEQVGCRPFLSHCSCSWSCVDSDAQVVDCPATCTDEQQLLLAPPACDCGAGGCGMILCDPASGGCGFGYLCQQLPGSAGYTVCTECANCELWGPA